MNPIIYILIILAPSYLRDPRQLMGMIGMIPRVSRFHNSEIWLDLKNSCLIKSV